MAPSIACVKRFSCRRVSPMRRTSIRAGCESSRNLPGDIPRRREEIPVQATSGDSRRSRRGHAGRRGEVVSGGQGCAALRSRVGPRAPKSVRPTHADARREGLRRAPACIRGRGGSPRPALDRRGPRIRNHRPRMSWMRSRPRCERPRLTVRQNKRASGSGGSSRDAPDGIVRRILATRHC
jgi:hypothetical protein